MINLYCEYCELVTIHGVQINYGLDPLSVYTCSTCGQIQCQENELLKLTLNEIIQETLLQEYI